MSDYSIALSGLQVARRAIDMVGTNIANATTEGYHRQDLMTASVHTLGLERSFGGVEISGVRRCADLVLDLELTLKQSDLGQNAQELSTLRLVESSLGELDAQGLGLAIDGYFNALRELASQPNSEALQYQAAWAADSMVQQFHQIDSFLEDLDRQVTLEARQAASEANGLIREIAQLNQEIQIVTTTGSSANTARDRRDQAVRELARIIDIDVTGYVGNNAAVNVSAWGTPLVTGGQYILLEAGAADSAGSLGVSVQGINYFQTNVSGGKLGGLISLKNEILSGIRGRVDTLAGEIALRSNQRHVQGIGLDGSFSELTGWPVAQEPLSQWDAWGADLSAGTLNVRVTDRQTGQAAIHSIDIDGDSTVETIAAALDAAGGLTADVADSALHIESADLDRYEFDFLPVPVADTASNPWSGTASPAVSGTFTGSEEETFSCTVTGPVAGVPAQVGVTEGLRLEIRNGAGELVGTHNMGLGYAAGDRIDIGSGISLSLPVGTVVSGEQFAINAVADSDTSGFLALAGINALFSGTRARDISVRDAILADPRRLATALGPDGSDNANAVRLADLADTSLPGLSHQNPTDFYRLIVTDIGNDISFRQSRQEAMEGAIEQLENEREIISGVDINEEAARLLVYQNMFQACAKFLTAQVESLEYLMNVV